MKMVKKLVELIKEIESENEPEVIFSVLLQREDHGFRNQIESEVYKFTENSNQVWILAPDIRQCQAKNRLMSDESYFTMDTVV